MPSPRVIKRSVQAYGSEEVNPPEELQNHERNAFSSHNKQYSLIFHMLSLPRLIPLTSRSPSRGPLRNARLKHKKRQKRGDTIARCATLSHRDKVLRGKMLFVTSFSYFAYQSFLMSNDHLNFRYSFLSSSVNMEEAS
jgi:hypothetical protein